VRYFPFIVGMNTTIKYALYIIGFSTAWLFVEKILGYHNTIIDWLFFTSLLWLICVGVFYVFFLRAECSNNSNWNYKMGFKAALMLTLYWLLGYSLVKLLYFGLLNAEYFNDLTLRGREWLTLSATSEENFDNATQMMEDFLRLVPYLIITVVIELIFGLIYALLLPAFVKKS